MRLQGASSGWVPEGHTPCAPHHVQAGQLYLRELRGLEPLPGLHGNSGFSRLVAFDPGMTKFGVLKYCRYIGRGRLWLNSIKGAASSSRIHFLQGA